MQLQTSGFASPLAYSRTRVLAHTCFALGRRRSMASPIVPINLFLRLFVYARDMVFETGWESTSAVVMLP